MSTGKNRVITAAVGIPVIIMITFLGGYFFLSMIAVVAIAAQLELYDLQRKAGWNPARTIGVLIGLAVLLRDQFDWLEPVLIILTLGLLMDSLWTGPEGNPLLRIAGTLIGVVYPVWMFSFLTSIRIGLETGLTANEAFGLTMMLIVIIWVTDTAAYYTGKSIGKHHLAPTISPNKTWEGSLGGVAGAIIVAVVFKLFGFSFLGWQDVGVFVLIGGVLSQCGDLIESTIKRSVQVKDSSGILPGHGGFLDRFDSMFVAVPLYYLYLSYVLNLF